MEARALPLLGGERFDKKSLSSPEQFMELLGKYGLIWDPKFWEVAEYYSRLRVARIGSLKVTVQGDEVRIFPLLPATE